MLDPQHFKDTFLPYHGHLYRTAYRLLNNGPNAEDVVQDVYVKLWNMREKLGGVNNMKAYATTITRNLCLDLLAQLPQSFTYRISASKHLFRNFY